MGKPWLICMWMLTPMQIIVMMLKMTFLLMKFLLGCQHCTKFIIL